MLELNDLNGLIYSGEFDYLCVLSFCLMIMTPYCGQTLFSYYENQ